MEILIIYGHHGSPDTAISESRGSQDTVISESYGSNGCSSCKGVSKRQRMQLHGSEAPGCKGCGCKPVSESHVCT
jgi:hypothetical protein